MATPALTASRPDPLAVIELLKPITWFPPMWALACGVVSSGYDVALERPHLVAVGLLLAGPLVCGTCQAVANWYGRHDDAIHDPGRPIPSGRLPGRTGLHFALLWTAVSLIVATLLGTWGLVATAVGLALAWAYSAPLLRLKMHGWWGTAAAGACYVGLPWLMGAHLASTGLLDMKVLAIAGLYSMGAHGVITLNQHAAGDSNRRIGVPLRPLPLGADPAARFASIVMALSQFAVVLLLLEWGHGLPAALTAILLIAQLGLMTILVRASRERALWLSTIGCSLYVTGMMIAALAIRPENGLLP